MSAGNYGVLVRETRCTCIYCEKPSHKSVIIGKQGRMLGEIGSKAREDIEKLLETKVMLKLWVKVREDWRNRKDDLKTLGYEDE